MKAVFVHDHYFVYNPNDGKYYDGSGGVFDEKLWKRYLEIFDSLIVVGRQKEELPNKLIDSTCKNVSFELIDILKKNTDRIFKKKQIYNELEKTLKKVDFAIIRLPSVLGYIAQEICEKYNIKYTLEVVACPWDAYTNYGNIKGKLIAPIEYKKLKSATIKSDNVIYVTQQFLQNRYPSDGNKIGISNVNIEQVKNIDEINYNLSGESFKVALIGSFHVKYKGHVEALNALKYIVDNKLIENIKLLLVGTGDPSWVIDYAKKLGIQDNVEIVGTIKAGADGVFPFLDSIDLYIHPSKQEGLPRVVIEALSRGRLVLGSSVAGIPELLNEKYLHKPGDWKKLANDIVLIFNDKKNWVEISKENINKAESYLETVLQKKRVDFINKIVE